MNNAAGKHMSGVNSSSRDSVEDLKIKKDLKEKTKLLEEKIKTLKLKENEFIKVLLFIITIILTIIIKYNL